MREIYTVYATNKNTKEVIDMGYFDSEDEAWWNIEHNLEWDEDDIIDEWTFKVVESLTDDEDWSFNEDEGFDPYCGSYTFDC